MASVARLLEEQLPAALHQRSSGKILFRMALRTVGLHVFLAGQLRFEFRMPVRLGDVTQHRIWPERVFAVRVHGLEAAALAIVANRAAKIGELMTPLPMSVPLHISQRGRIRMRGQRFRVSLESRI